MYDTVSPVMETVLQTAFVEFVKSIVTSGFCLSVCGSFIVGL